MFGFSRFPEPCLVVTPFFPGTTLTTHLESDADPKIKVNERLVKNDVDGANQAAQRIFNMSSQNEALKKIVDHCLVKGDVEGAKRAANQITSLFSQSNALEKIVDRYLSVGDIPGAKQVAKSIQSTFVMNSAYRKIINVCFEKEDFAQAKSIANSNCLADSDVTSALDRILNYELGKNDFVEAIDTCSKSTRESRYEKVAEKIKKVKPDAATLKQIENTVSGKISSLFPGLRAIILRALMSVFASMGNQSEVNRLKLKIEKLEEFEKQLSLEPYYTLKLARLIQKIAAITIGTSVGTKASVLGFSNPASVALGAGAALGIMHPNIFRPANLVAVAAGAAATTLGAAPFIAGSVGVSTAILARSPALKAATLGAGRLAADALDVAVNGVAIPILEDGANLLVYSAERLAKGVIGAGSMAYKGAAGLLRGVDKLLDAAAGN